MDNWGKELCSPNPSQDNSQMATSRNGGERGCFLHSCSILRKIYGTLRDLTCFTYQK